jgi:alpha-galactosidase
MIMGANLTKLDEFTRGLMQNKEVLELNQEAVESGPGLLPLQKDGKDSYPQRYWYARTGGLKPKHYLAVFNLEDHATSSTLPWAIFHLSEKSHELYDVWNQKKVAKARSLHVELPPHGCALYRVE